MSLKDDVMSVLEGIVDPCSLAAGAPAGLVSMGLVEKVDITTEEGSTQVHVGLVVTEPGCMISALFQMTARQRIAALEGVDSVQVDVDHGFLWTPDRQDPAYREKLRVFRACQLEHLKSVKPQPAVPATVSFEAKQETHALVRENGTGKSTRGSSE